MSLMPSASPARGSSLLDSIKPGLTKGRLPAPPRDLSSLVEHVGEFQLRHFPPFRITEELLRGSCGDRIEQAIVGQQARHHATGEPDAHGRSDVCDLIACLRLRGPRQPGRPRLQQLIWAVVRDACLAGSDDSCECSQHTGHAVQVVHSTCVLQADLLLQPRLDVHETPPQRWFQPGHQWLQQSPAESTDPSTHPWPLHQLGSHSAHPPWRTSSRARSI